MYSEELEKEALSCLDKYTLLKKQANEDYEKVKTIIEKSDKMLEKYEEKYKNIIKEKNIEIKKLEEEFFKLKKEISIDRKILDNIPIKERKKYVKRRTC